MHHRLPHLRIVTGELRCSKPAFRIRCQQRTNQLVRHHAAGIEHRQLAVPFLCRLCHSDHSFRHSHQTETGNICRRFTLLQLFPALVFQSGQATIYAPYHRFDPERFPALPGKLFQCLAAGKLQSQHQPHPIDRLSGFQVQRGAAGVIFKAACSSGSQYRESVVPPLTWNARNGFSQAPSLPAEYSAASTCPT